MRHQSCPTGGQRSPFGNGLAKHQLNPHLASTMWLPGERNVLRMQIVQEHKHLQKGGEPEKMRSQAKRLRDKHAANLLLEKAQELESEKSAFMRKHMDALQVSRSDLIVVGDGY